MPAKRLVVRWAAKEPGHGYQSWDSTAREWVPVEAETIDSLLDQGWAVEFKSYDHEVRDEPESVAELFVRSLG